MVTVLLEAFQLRWKPGCPVRSVTNVQGNDSHLRVCHKDGKLPGCDHCNAIYSNILFGHLGTIVGLVLFVFFICAGEDWNVDGKSDDGNTHRVSGNKVLVPPGVVEDEGKHAVDKHLRWWGLVWLIFNHGTIAHSVNSLVENHRKQASPLVEVGMLMSKVRVVIDNSNVLISSPS